MTLRDGMGVDSVAELRELCMDDGLLSDVTDTLVQEIIDDRERTIAEAYITGAVAVDVAESFQYQPMNYQPGVTEDGLVLDPVEYLVWHRDPPAPDDSAYPLDSNRYRIERYELEAVDIAEFEEALERSDLEPEDLDPERMLEIPDHIDYEPDPSIWFPDEGDEDE